jgi:xanthine dehydrogenase accessory factor
MNDWLGGLREVLAAEPRAIIVTVAATRGSVPRAAGTHMIVGRGALRGTIGGGHLEFDAIRIARDALAAGHEGGHWLVRFPLAASLGQCCGGVTTLLFQPVSATAEWPATLAGMRDAGQAVARVVAIGMPLPASPLVTTASTSGSTGLPAPALQAAQRLLAAGGPAAMLVHDGEAAFYVETVVAADFNVVVFGNGHVGRALVQVLSTIAGTVTWIDQREHDFPPATPDNVSAVATDAPEDGVVDAPPASWFLVMTHSHALDLELTARILGRGDFAYLGLIGSRSKRAQFERRLAARGVSAASMSRLTCPIGAGAIRSKEPGAIAIAVAAEMLQLRERRAAGTADRRTQP